MPKPDVIRAAATGVRNKARRAIGRVIVKRLLACERIAEFVNATGHVKGTDCTVLACIALSGCRRSNRDTAAREAQRLGYGCRASAAWRATA